MIGLDNFFNAYWSFYSFDKLSWFSDCFFYKVIEPANSSGFTAISSHVIRSYTYIDFHGSLFLPL